MSSENDEFEIREGFLGMLCGQFATNCSVVSPMA